MNIAIVKAGGVGLRLGSKIPKQFLTVYDKPLLVYTLERMQNMAKIDQIIVPTLENWIPVVESYAAEYGLTKVKHVIRGGESNLGSLCQCYSTVESLGLDEGVIVIQDGNRPLVSEKVVNSLIDSAAKFGNAFACMPTSSFVMISKDGKTADSYIDRSMVYLPQSDALSYQQFIQLKDVFMKNIDTAVSINDVMIDQGIKLHIVDGDWKNFKITTKDDLELFKHLIGQQLS